VFFSHENGQKPLFFFSPTGRPGFWLGTGCGIYIISICFGKVRNIENMDVHACFCVKISINRCRHTDKNHKKETTRND
jgi:hypothetical protein